VQRLIDDGVARIAYQVQQVALLVGLMADERLDDLLCGEALVHEERERRHVE